MDLRERLRNLGTFVAFTIQGQHKKEDLIPPMPEPTQQVGWDPEGLAKLASRKQKEQKK